MFNYGVDEKGPYIEALRPFYELYASQYYLFMQENARERMILDIAKKLVHETHHHWFEPKTREDDDRAEQAAVRTIFALQRNSIYCRQIGGTPAPDRDQPTYRSEPSDFVYLRALRKLTRPNLLVDRAVKSVYEKAKTESAFNSLDVQHGVSYIDNFLMPARVSTSPAGIAIQSAENAPEVYKFAGRIEFLSDKKILARVSLKFQEKPETLGYACEEFAPPIDFH